MDFREQRVLGAGFLVGGGLEGADCSLDCGVLVVHVQVSSGASTSEHVLPLLIVYDGPGLKVLRLEPVGDGKGFRFWRAGLNGLLLLLLLCALLRLHLRLLLCHCLLSQPLYVFLNRNAVFLCLSSKLHLYLLDLLWRGLFSIGSQGYGNGE